MRLEPERTSLSGIAVRPAVRAAPAAPAIPRTCALCGVDDQPSFPEGEGVSEPPSAGAQGNPKVEHSVTIELRYLKAANEAEARKHLTVRMARLGWRYKFFQGRHAMERFVCRPCLRSQEIMARDWARKAAGDSPKAKGNEFYRTLCGD